MRKILFIHNSLELGGAEKSLVNLLNSIDSTKVEVDLLIISDKNINQHSINSNINISFSIDRYDLMKNRIISITNNIKTSWFKRIFGKLLIYCVNKFFNIFYEFITTIPQKIKNSQYDYIIVYNQGLFPKIALKMFSSKIPKIVFYHQGHIESISEQYSTYKKFTKIVFVSHSVYNFVTLKYPEFREKSVVIHNIINTDEILSKANDTSISTCLKRSNMILSIGRLSEEKGFLRVIDIVLVMLEKGFNDFKWLIIGDGPEYEILKDKIHINNLQDYIELAGLKSNPYKYIKECNIYVQPSVVESYGLAMMEAMILKKIVVSTNTLGAQEIISNNINGYIIADNSNITFANTIIEILSRPRKYNHIIKNLEKLDIKIMTKETLDSFYNIINCNND